MGGDASAFAALGLEPGADAASIEQAYKRLIKQHHPDRAGGDAKRAAEITKAYRELRGPLGSREALIFNDHAVARANGRSEWVTLAVAAIGGVAALLLITGPVARLVPAAAPNLPLGEIAAEPPAIDAMDAPIEAAIVTGAAHDARRIAHDRDEMALASASRDCHHKLRTDPSIRQLDRCAAFDDAVVQLQDRDPLRDQGPFSELAVTGRQWSAASGLSNDYLAIDSRLSRIRLQVELALVPATSTNSANSQN